ncbi:MAG: hypothetical protein B6244_01515 [Candidatus Cloacimonetes bacterium 4572_55]|nr:MAG: hypothetical protein B6244_01515 [Candidatus Cloacimonetes bacterium 4572_55]
MDFEILRCIDLFENLDESELEAISAIMSVQTYPAGHTIFREGEIPEKLYIIQHGSVRITKHIDGAGEELLVVLEKNDYFGEMALIDQAPRSAQAQVIEDLSTLEIDKQQLINLMEWNEKLANKLLWKFSCILSKRLRELHDKLEGLFTITRLY